MRIGIDLDGVIVDFEGGWVERWDRMYPHSKVSPAARRVQHWDEMGALTDRSTSSWWSWFHHTGGFRDLPIYPHAPAALEELADADHELWAVTSRNLRHQAVTYGLCLGLGVFAAVVHTPEKWEIGLDLLVEDAPHTIEQTGEAHGSDSVIIVRQPWNRHLTYREHGYRVVQDLSHVVDVL